MWQLVQRGPLNAHIIAWKFAKSVHKFNEVDYEQYSHIYAAAYAIHSVSVVVSDVAFGKHTAQYTIRHQKCGEIEWSTQLNWISNEGQRFPSDFWIRKLMPFQIATRLVRVEWAWVKVVEFLWYWATQRDPFEVAASSWAQRYNSAI